MIDEKIVAYLARDGLCEKEIIKRLGVTKKEWKEWKSSNPNSAELLSTKTLTDYAVEDALLKRALGYSYEEVKESDKEKGTETVRTKKEVAPDISAISLWLKNRCPERWGEKRSDDTAAVEAVLSAFDKEAEED